MGKGKHAGGHVAASGRSSNKAFGGNDVRTVESAAAKRLVHATQSSHHRPTKQSAQPQQQPSVTPSVPIPKNQLFVGNLPKTARQEDVAEIFGRCGLVEAVELRQNRQSAHAIVRMYIPADAAAAIERLHGADFDNQTIVVRHDKQA